MHCTMVLHIRCFCCIETKLSEVQSVYKARPLSSVLCNTSVTSSIEMACEERNHMSVDCCCNDPIIKVCLLKYGQYFVSIMYVKRDKLLQWLLFFYSFIYSQTIRRLPTRRCLYSDVFSCKNDAGIVAFCKRYCYFCHCIQRVSKLCCYSIGKLN